MCANARRRHTPSTTPARCSASGSRHWRRRSTGHRATARRDRGRPRLACRDRRRPVDAAGVDRGLVAQPTRCFARSAVEITPSDHSSDRGDHRVHLRPLPTRGDRGARDLVRSPSRGPRRRSRTTIRRARRRPSARSAEKAHALTIASDFLAARGPPSLNQAGPYPRLPCPGAPRSACTRCWSSSGPRPGSRSRSGSRMRPRCSGRGSASPPRACCCSASRRCGAGRCRPTGRSRSRSASSPSPSATASSTGASSTSPRG